jgi:hypothetical protein
LSVTELGVGITTAAAVEADGLAAAGDVAPGPEAVVDDSQPARRRANTRGVARLMKIALHKG